MATKPQIAKPPIENPRRSEPRNSNRQIRSFAVAQTKNDGGYPKFSTWNWLDNRSEFFYTKEPSSSPLPTPTPTTLSPPCVLGLPDRLFGMRLSLEEKSQWRTFCLTIFYRFFSSQLVGSGWLAGERSPELEAGSFFKGQMGIA